MDSAMNINWKHEPDGGRQSEKGSQGVFGKRNEVREDATSWAK